MNQKLTKLTRFGVILARPGGKKAIKTNGFFNIFAFPIFGPPDLFWTPLGPLLALSWVPSGPSWSPLGAPRGPLGAHGQPLGPPKPFLDSSWGHLRATVCFVEPLWRQHGPFWSSQKAFGTHFGANLVHFSSNLHALRVFCMRNIEFPCWNRTGYILFRNQNSSCSSFLFRL